MCMFPSQILHFDFLIIFIFLPSFLCKVFYMTSEIIFTLITTGTNIFNN